MLFIYLDTNFRAKKAIFIWRQKYLIKIKIKTCLFCIGTKINYLKFLEMVSKENITLGQKSKTCLFYRN